jgi:hypothetical protein
MWPGGDDFLEREKMFLIRIAKYDPKQASDIVVLTAD